MKRILIALTVLSLAGCTTGDLLAPSGPAAKLYTLKAPLNIQVTAPVVNWQLLIETPNAPMDLNLSRIAVIPSLTRIDYYANAAWADRPSAMFEELLLQSFAKSGKIDAVQRQSGGLKADFMLTTDLQDFEVDASSDNPSAHVGVTMRLIRTRDRTIVASRQFESAIQVRGDLEEAVYSFDSALGEILPQIVDWALTQGSRNP
jgi:cholesterol transport system auxiliary component